VAGEPVSGSSGVRVTSRIINGECDECDFAGEVDQWIDPETHTSVWECPQGHQHEDTTWDEGDDRDEDA
jgi:hypothetical protein